MAFLGGIGKAFSSAFNAVKSFATSGLGKTLIQGAATLFGGPLGGTIAKAATNLLSGGFNVKNLIKTGLDVFGGMSGKFGLGDLVKNLPSALKNPSGLLGGLGNVASQLFSNGKFDLGGVAKVAGQLLGQTSIGQKVMNILGKASNLITKGTGFAQDAQGVLGSVSKFLSNFGINSNGLNNVSGGISNVLAAAQKVQDILGKVGGFLSPPQSDMMMLRA
ncbi:MAG: hypothetical protein WAQ98_33050 [Blastocatellia bacterium]